MTTPWKYQPDPFALQITSLVILRRAVFLMPTGRVFAKLVGLSDDYDRYGNFLAQMRGVPTPFDPKAKEVPTSAEVFLKTDEFVGFTQRVTRPSVGMEIRHFRLAALSQAAKSRLGPTPKMAASFAVIDLIQHPNLQWEVMHAEIAQKYRRRGFATMLYDHIEKVLDTKLRASGWLSFDAYHFWQKRDPSVVQWHRKWEYLSGLWLSPKQLDNLKAVTEFKLMDAIKNYPPTRPN